MSKLVFTIFSVVFISAFSAGAWATKPGDNARASGIKTCAEQIENETGVFLTDQPHESHDFVAPGERNVDKRPFYSMSFRNYTDVGISHINIVATRSDLGIRNTKCDMHISETFASPRTCEEWSRDLAGQNFRALPLASDVTLMENVGSENIFSFFYLTDISGSEGSCLVSRRRMVYER